MFCLVKTFTNFQIRWAEKLYQGKDHYLTRWTLVLFGYSIRLHHWIGNDVGPHLHDHPFNFISILLKGGYTNITSDQHYQDCPYHITFSRKHIKALSMWYANGERRHRLEIDSGGAWTLLLCGRPYRKWGFWVNNHLWRPLRYFYKYGKAKKLNK